MIIVLIRYCVGWKRYSWNHCKNICGFMWNKHIFLLHYKWWIILNLMKRTFLYLIHNSYACMTGSVHWLWLMFWKLSADIYSILLSTSYISENISFVQLYFYVYLGVRYNGNPDIESYTVILVLFVYCNCGSYSLSINLHRKNPLVLEFISVIFYIISTYL